jgi:SPP1 family predicted phage head-tail adaptor
MRMDKQITLRSTVTTSNATGLAVETNTDTIVYADVQSVRRAEFYASNAAGNTVDIVFIVNADDYDGQMAVVYDSVDYSVVRSYQKGLGRVELNCQRR